MPILHPAYQSPPPNEKTDSHTGYVTGEGGTILKTSDGGGFPVGIKNDLPNSGSLQIFPNPTNGKINIRMSWDSPNNSNRFVLNIYGKQLLNKRITEQTTQVDISSLPSGIYIVMIKNEKTVQLTKVVKE